MLASLKLDLQTHRFLYVSILHVRKRNTHLFTSAWMLFKLFIWAIESFVSKSVPVILSIKIHKDLGECDCFKGFMVSGIFVHRHVYQ